MYRRVGFAATMLSLVWGFRALLFTHAPVAFSSPSEDLAYGYFVPLFSLYVVWTEWRRIRASAGSPSWGGFLACLPPLLVGAMGVRGIQIRFEIIAFAGLLVAVPWAFYGRRTAAAVLFPAAFLLFCLPLAAYLDIITVHLRLFATSVAYETLRLVGAEVTRQGSIVTSANGGFSIDIATPCSGIRSIFALMALTAGYAYFNHREWWRRGLLFAASVPLAIVGNVARIVTICLVGQYASPKFANGFYHDYSGYLVFAVAILLMLLVSDLLKAKGKRAKEPDADAVPAAPPAHGASHLPAWFAGVTVMAAMVWLAASPEAVLCDDPGRHLGEIAGFDSQDQPISRAELASLPEDTRVEHRLYTARRDGRTVEFAVTMVVGGRSKSSIHRPELCLPSQGFLMSDPRTVGCAGREWRFIDLAAGGLRRGTLAYTFFNQEGFATASHLQRIFRDVCDRTFHNRIDRWTMITVFAPAGGEADMESLIEGLEVFR